jgi:hypothetical protein
MFLAAFTSAWQAKPQAVHRNRAWLSRESRSTCPHAEHRWLVNAGLIFSTRPGALSSSRRTSRPHPDPRMARFSPALARTFRPGFSRVPLADRVMFVICRSSTRIRSNRRESLLLSYPSANRDEEVFDDPFRFDAGRDPNKHLAFGFGVHYCLGAALARMETRALFAELLPRLESVELAGQPEWVATTFVGGLKYLPIRYTLTG